MVSSGENVAMALHFRQDSSVSSRFNPSSVTMYYSPFIYITDPKATKK